jgi:hypothetical protein
VLITEVAANLKACFFLAQHAAISMRRQKHGRIIFTTSIAGILGLGKVHGYTASKSGLIGLTRSLAKNGPPIFTRRERPAHGGSSSPVLVLIVMALRGSLGLMKAAVVADCAALNDGPRRHIANAITNKRPEPYAGRNGVVAHPRIGLVPAITALWVGLVGRPLQRIVAHIFASPDFCPGLANGLYQRNADFLRDGLALANGQKGMSSGSAFLL